jgi:Tol biopolymer transport system component
MIDGDTQTRQILTWDGYYYAHPNLTPDTLSLIFESKRSDNIGSGGLSVNSDIYKMDLQTKEVENFSEDLSNLISESIGHSVRYPSLSHSGRKLAITRLVNWQFHLSVVDIQNGSIVDISTNEKFRPRPSAVLEWSANNNNFIYGGFYGLNMMVVLVDVENLNTTVIKPVINETNELDVRSCMAGSWINNYEFIYQCIRKDIDFIDVLVYDIRNESSRILKSFDNKNFEMSMNSLQISNDGETLVFIGIDSNTKEEDIWKFNLMSDSLTKITTNGYNKGWLRWYEDF